MSQETKKVSKLKEAYDNYLKILQGTCLNVDPLLLHNVMDHTRVMSKERAQQEKGFWEVRPLVELYIRYHKQIDLDEKITKLRTVFYLEVEKTDNPMEVYATSRMSIEKIHEISKDNDIECIGGKVSPVLRS